MEIRKARQGELPEILGIYEGARAFMRKSGNPTQWGDNYPAEEVLAKDIELGQLYVICEADELFGVFAFIKGPDKDYN